MFDIIDKNEGAYTLEDLQEIKELNAVGRVLRHNKTKARIIVISNEDNNKVFSIGFRTPPKDDTGVPHILEHSVLCGSKEFPVKDPFIELAKGSLNTFLNAMTYPDKTVYPIASCNDKDFRNLMHVYLDAVFYPDIYQKPEILKQEGWHYELNNVEEPITYNGVVYNEMKGSLSSPEQQLFRDIQKSLLKDTAYSYESGGDPEFITDLTNEEFLTFHSNYYHPSNSYIYLYGDMNYVEDLNFLDEHYLSNFEEKQVDSSIAFQEPYKETIRQETCYSITETEKEENNTYLSYNAVIGTSLDKDLYLAFQILDYVLLSSPGALLKKALVDAGIGSDVFSSYDNGILQPTYSIVAKNANGEDEEQFLEIIDQTINLAIKKGIEPKAIEAAMNYFEFKYKEANFGRFPKGLMYGLQMFDSWLYDDAKPFIHLQTNDTFASLKEKSKDGYFEQLLQKYLIDNTHKSIVILKPQKGLNAQLDAKEKEKLAKFKETLSLDQLNQMIEDTKALKRYQEEPTPIENLEKIPLLTIDDIDKKVRPLSNKEYKIEDVKVVHHNIFTNGIVYLNLAFDLKDLSTELMPYAALLSCVLQNVDTEKSLYNELSNEINIQTGGIGSVVSVLTKAKDQGDYLALFEVKSKVLFPKVQNAFLLIEEILFTSKLDDKKRLKEIIAEVKSSMQEKLVSAGHSVAANRAVSYFAKASYIKELTSGIDFYKFLVDLSDHFEEKAAQIIQQLQKTAQAVFTKENLIISYNGNEDANATLKQSISHLLPLLHKPQEGGENTAHLQILNEGFKTSSKVQYVATAGNFVDAGYTYTGALKVLQVIFSYDYLWNNIRVKGGAYGCMCGFSRSGDSYLTSYRDPNLMETYEIYRNAYKFVEQITINERDMTKYIIGAISNMDTPLEPSAQGARSFNCYLLGVTTDDLQKERDQLLTCTEDTIKGLAGLVKSVANNDIICVIGNDDKLTENAKNFKELCSIF